MVKVDRKLIERVAKIARLELTEEECKKFEKELNEVLAAFSTISEVKTTHKISLQPVDIKNKLREDIEEKSLTQDDALKNTIHKKDGYFKGPRIV